MAFDDPCFVLGEFVLVKCNYRSDKDLFKRGNSESTLDPAKLPSTEISKITLSFFWSRI